MNRARSSSQLAASVHRRPAGAAGDRLRVLVADSDGFARSMMRFALRSSDRIAVVHIAPNSREALELARYYRPSVAIVDTALPPGGGVELVGKLLQSLPDTRVLTMSVGDDQAAIAALRAGAVGHIGKEIEPESLAELVGRAADGEVIVSQPLLSSLLDALREVPASGWRPLRSRLTNREWEIIELLGEDATTQRIAEQLVLSPVTVYSHVKSLLRKLGVRSRRDAVIAAERLRREEALSRSPT
jgi:DNA-binding NarL/FixJ family response regulator